MLFLVGLLALFALPLYWRLVRPSHRPIAFALIGWATLFWYEPRSLIILGGLTLAVHALAMRGVASGRRTSLGVAFVLLALAAQKTLALQGVALVGFSYACFRMLHALFDHAAGRLETPSRLRFLEYVLFPAYFLSGPIARYQEHVGGLVLDRLAIDDALQAMARIAGGLAKKVVVAAPLFRLSDASFADPTGGAMVAWGGLLAYSFALYADFSGYTDVALGAARLFGFRGPENFNWPYLASDIGDFWRRWHMTLSGWLRDYLFVPLSGVLSGNAWFRKRPLVLGSVSSLITMAACGVWHGFTLSFLIWGLGHGALIGLHQLYRQRLLSRLPSSRRKLLLASRAYSWAATALTFLSVTLLWTFFRLPPAAAIDFLGRLMGV